MDKDEEKVTRPALYWHSMLLLNQILCISIRKELVQNAEANLAKDGLSNLDYRMVKKVDYKTHIWILADLKHDGE